MELNKPFIQSGKDVYEYIQKSVEYLNQRKDFQIIILPPHHFNLLLPYLDSIDELNNYITINGIEKGLDELCGLKVYVSSHTKSIQIF